MATIRHWRLDPHRRVSLLVGTAAVLTISSWAGYLLAFSAGVTGVAQSPVGCSCHSATPNANGAVTVSITGPSGVLPGSTNAYTISVSGGPPPGGGGFNLVADMGTLIAGANNSLVGGELTHSNATQRSWSFTWTAPNANTTAHFYAVSQSCNLNGTNQGDSWNWYGGAVSTPFSITVSAPTPTGRRSWGHLKTIYR